MPIKNYLNNYLPVLSSSENTIKYSALACRYGKFVIYCIMGPDENIVHLTLAPAKHRKAVKLLSGASASIDVKELQQKSFPYNSIFQDYFSGRRTDFPIEVDSPFLEAGTDFQKKVWHRIKSVPFGMTITYQKLAELAGSPKGARAAGMACGANPLALIIPCHRILASNGLGGYAGGIHIKKALLALEQSQGNSIHKRA